MFMTKQTVEGTGMDRRSESPSRTRSATTESLKQQLENLRRSVAALGYSLRTAAKVRIAEIERELSARGVNIHTPSMTDEGTDRPPQQSPD